MKPHNESLDIIIRKNFPKDIAFKRVQKEISLLSSLNKNFYKISVLNSPIGLKIMIETLKSALQNFCEDSLIGHISMVLFEISLEPKFPFIYPKIFCRTTFCKPSLADGRDLLIDIIKKTWTPSILLHEIIILFPIFIKETLKKDRESLQKIGTYHLGCMYNLEDFLLMDSVDVFPVNELMPNNKTVPRYLVLSQSNLSNFEIIDKKNNQMKLISWANLQSLLNIKRKKDEQYTLILTWKDAYKSEGLTQIIALEQADKFCELIIKNMKSFGVKISKNIIKQPDLTINDVTIKAYDQIDIMDLLENITILESRLLAEFNIDIVNTLMMLYQKAIEYYSALNDPAFDDYLEKLHLLLSREDVQILLKSKAETNKPTKLEKSKSGGLRKSINEKNEDEEEEEKKENSNQNIQSYFPSSKTPEKKEMATQENIVKKQEKVIKKPIEDTNLIGVVSEKNQEPEKNKEIIFDIANETVNKEEIQEIKPNEEMQEGNIQPNVPENKAQDNDKIDIVDNNNNNSNIPENEEEKKENKEQNENMNNNNNINENKELVLENKDEVQEIVENFNQDNKDPSELIQEINQTLELEAKENPQENL